MTFDVIMFAFIA